MEGMLLLEWEKLWSLISTLPLIHGGPQLHTGGTGARATLEGTQGPLPHLLSVPGSQLLLNGLPSLG